MAVDLEDHFDRLEWVRNELIASLGRELEAYEQDKPYRLHTETDWVRQRKTLIATSTRTPPKNLRIRAGALIHELRAILDSLVCTLAIRHNPNVKLGGISLPITNSKAEFFDRQAQTKISKLSPADRAVIAQIKPWQDGNPWLYALHHADRVHKHQRLLISAVASKGGVIRGDFKASDRWTYGGDLAVGAKVADLALDSFPDVEVTVRVCFSEPSFVKRKELVPAIYDLSRMVQAVLEVFK